MKLIMIDNERVHRVLKLEIFIEKDKVMKKVLILNHGLASGGTDSFVINIMNYLDKSKYDVNFVMAVDKTNRKQFREDEVREMGIPIFYTNDLNGIRKILNHCVKLYRLLKSENIDVFHANMDLFNGLNMFVAWLARTPIRVCHSHNSMSQYESNTGKHILVTVYRFVMRKMIWVFSNRRCGCSEKAMDYLYLNNWRNDKNSKIIFNGINCDKFRNMSIEEKKIKKEKLRIKQGNHVIIVVGRMSEQKNPRKTVEIIKELSKKRQDFEVLWVGTGELEEEIKALVENKKIKEYIKFLGTRQDVNELLQCSEIFLMPSLFEGQPIALIEAQVAGLECLVSDTITHNLNIGGCIFLNTKDIDVWSRSISDCMDRKLELTICDSKMNYFDIKKTVKDLEGGYMQSRKRNYDFNKQNFIST